MYRKPVATAGVGRCGIRLGNSPQLSHSCGLHSCECATSAALWLRCCACCDDAAMLRCHQDDAAMTRLALRHAAMLRLGGGGGGGGAAAAAVAEGAEGGGKGGRGPRPPPPFFCSRAGGRAGGSVF
eukprot:gene14570-biopygen10040